MATVPGVSTRPLIEAPSPRATAPAPRNVPTSLAPAPSETAPRPARTRCWPGRRSQHDLAGRRGAERRTDLEDEDPARVAVGVQGHRAGVRERRAARVDAGGNVIPAWSPPNVSVLGSPAACVSTRSARSHCAACAAGVLVVDRALGVPGGNPESRRWGSARGRRPVPCRCRYSRRRCRPAPSTTRPCPGSRRWLPGARRTLRTWSRAGPRPAALMRRWRRTPVRFVPRADGDDGAGCAMASLSAVQSLLRVTRLSIPKGLVSLVSGPRTQGRPGEQSQLPRRWPKLSRTVCARTSHPACAPRRGTRTGRSRRA